MIVALLLVSCSPAIPSQKSCSSDADCMKATCCHAKDAVNSKYAPDCSGQICTMDCEPDTLDCGQGSIQCLEQQCTAVISPNGN